MSNRATITVPVYQGGRARRKAPCQFALDFRAWCDELLAAVRQQPTAAVLVMAKAELQDKYHEFRSIVGREHRDNVGTHGHPCIWHVYEETYLRFREYERRFLSHDLEQMLTPPQVSVDEEQIDLGDVIDGTSERNEETTADSPGS